MSALALIEMLRGHTSVLFENLAFRNSRGTPETTIMAELTVKALPNLEEYLWGCCRSTRACCGSCSCCFVEVVELPLP